MGGLGCLIGLVVLAAVVAGPVIALVSFVGDATRRDRRRDRRARRTPRSMVPEPDGDGGRRPSGIAGRSMVREAELRRARSAGSRGEELGRPMSIRLSPDRASMQMVKGGKLRPVVTVDFRGELDPGPTAGIGGAPPTFPLGEGRPGRAGAARARRGRALPGAQAEHGSTTSSARRTRRAAAGIAGTPTTRTTAATSRATRAGASSGASSREAPRVGMRERRQQRRLVVARRPAARRRVEQLHAARRPRRRDRAGGSPPSRPRRRRAAASPSASQSGSTASATRSTPPGGTRPPGSGLRTIRRSPVSCPTRCCRGSARPSPGRART